METTTMTADTIQLQVASTPGLMWQTDDDLCDCTFQRIGFWTNPYMGSTMLVRLCCMWQKLDEMFPGMVMQIPAFYDYNKGRFDEGAQLWNGEADMPRAVWYRYLAAAEGKSLAEIRETYAAKEPPKGIPAKPAQPTKKAPKKGK